MSVPSTVPEDRYGAPPPARRWVLGALVVVLSLGFLAWVVWAAWFHGTPKVTSELVSYTVVDEHSATAVLDVELGDAAQPRCLVRAVSADHTPVGELSFVPVDGRNEVTIRTEREATSVEKVGCTAAGQPNAQ